MDIHIVPVTGAEGAGKYIIYRPLAGLAFVGNRAMADLAMALAETPDMPLNPEIRGFLDAIGFMDPDPVPPLPIDSQFRPTMAVLLLTNQCQLRCTYCYASAGEYIPQELTLELAQAAIDEVCRQVQGIGLPEFEVSFHGGGEPTFAWGLLTQAVEYARQKPLPAKITLTSNGIWSEKQIDWILNNLDSVSLSMDGAPVTQDRNRPLLSHGPSSPYVLRVIEAMDRAEYPYGIRLTAAQPWTLAEDIRFICEETKCQSMQVEPAFNVKRGGHSEPTEEEVAGFVKAYLDAYEIATQAGRRLHYSGARLGLVSTVFCTAPYGALIANADGEMVACYEIAGDNHPLARLSTIGHIEDGQVVVDHDARNHLHGLIDERRAACRDCFCYWSCAGDCYARVFAAGDHLQRGGRCEINRRITEKLLLRRIADGEGVWKGELSAPPECGAPL